MRIFALSLVCLFIAAYRGQQTRSPRTAALAACSKEQAPSILSQSTDGGMTWQNLGQGLPDSLQTNYVFAQDGEVYLGTENKGLYHSGDPAMGLWQQEDIGGIVPNAGDIVLNKRIMGIFPGRSGLYVTVAQGGFFRKIPGTGLWQPMTSEALKYAMVNTVLENPDGTIFISCGNSCGNGIYKSKDDGKTWKQVFSQGWVTGLVAAGDALVANGPQGLLRSTDGGEHWEVVLSEGGVGISVERIEGGFAAITYNTDSETRRIRTSADGGKTWQPIDTDLPPHASIASIVQVGKFLFCGHPDGIFRSADQGKTWTLILPSIGKKVFNLSVSGKMIYAVPRDGGC